MWGIEKSELCDNLEFYWKYNLRGTLTMLEKLVRKIFVKKNKGVKLFKE
jgi:hypothetical protein